jgi:sporulation protein YlmC with PRC-barrel domain
MRIYTPAIAATALVIASSAMAQQAASAAKAETLSSVPSNSLSITNYYRQNVYDKADQKIGQVADVLMTEDGKITAFVIGAGGFLGMGKHDVVVPVSALSNIKKNGKTYLVMDTTKDALKSASGFKYDRTAATWVRDDQATEGRDRPAHRKKP